MCGTNVIIRLSYLREIGGMDETCITEDLGTSFIFHSNGYKSIYLDSVLAEGMPPPSLSAYFTQQMRWAYGTMQHVKKCVRTFLTRPRSLNVLQWWEYAIVSSSWYFLVGFAFSMWIIYITLVLLLGKTQLSSVPFNLPFLLFIILTGSQLVTSVRERGYKVRDLILAHVLTCSAFPTYIQAIFYGLVGKRLGFVVTPKGKMHVLPPTRLLPNVILLALLVASVAVGIWRVATAQMTSQQYIEVIIWGIWYIVMLSSVFILYFEDITKEAADPMKLSAPEVSSYQSGQPKKSF
jgi:cellulose synthase (UDP-forming)